MKCILIISLLIALTKAETFTTENDNLDIEAVVNNLHILKTYFDCFNDKALCDEVQADFKKDLPEAIQGACSKCTAAQKHIFKRFLEVAAEKLPEDLNYLKKKYDPESKYFASLQAAIADA